MKLRRGDTLIEVALALGIFSMVAISIVSVVSASTSGAQSSLETTVAREEVDVQAEALRFIHDSYIAGGQSNSVNNDRYRELWRAITGSAKNKADSLTFNPTTCKELYDGSALQDQGAFIINPRNLGLINTEDRSLLDDAINQIVIRPPVNATDNGVFFAPTTYPRLLYGAPSQTENQLNNQSLLALTASDDANLRRAEGIYVVAIQDGETTAIVNQNGTVKRAAYYDFYIRTCWFAPGADRPSSVSTVIRLYDPDIIIPSVRITFSANHDNIAGDPSIMPDQLVRYNTNERLNINRFERPGYTFVGWSTNPAYDPLLDASANGAPLYQDGAMVNFTDNVLLYAVWTPNSV